MERCAAYCNRRRHSNATAQVTYGMTICKKCNRVEWDGGGALGNGECSPYNTFACDLIEAIIAYAPDNIKLLKAVEILIDEKT